MYDYLISDLKSEIRAAECADSSFADGVPVKLLEDCSKQLDLAKTKVTRLQDENTKLRNQTKQIVEEVLYEFVAKIVNTYSDSKILRETTDETILDDICVVSNSNLQNFIEEYLKEF